MWPFALPWAAALGYGALSVRFELDRVHHYELISLAVQYAAMLPALIWALRIPSGKTSPEAAWLKPCAFAACILFVLAAAWWSWHQRLGVMISDESAYRFQARIYAEGMLRGVPLPQAPATTHDTPLEYHFAGCIMRPDQWIGRYPPVWPAVLALGLRARAEFLINPLLAALLFALTYLSGRELFDGRTASLAALLLALSPYVFINSTWTMSHMFTATLLAGATLFLARAIRLRRISYVAAMYTCIGVTCLARPLTGALFGLVFTSLLMVRWKEDRRLQLTTLLAAAILGSLTVAAYMCCNYVYTSNPLVVPYAMFRDSNWVVELSLRPASLGKNLRTITRASLQDTFSHTPPFVFAAAAFAAWRGRRRPEVLALASLFPLFVMAHLALTEGSGMAGIGERYYFETYPAVALLAAWSAVQLLETTRAEAFRQLMAALVILQISEHFAAGAVCYDRARPVQAVRELLERLPQRDVVVFLQPSEINPDTQLPDFIPNQMNPNRPDWRRDGCVYLVDPGVDRRTEVACRFAKRSSALTYVVTYDPVAGIARESAAEVSCGTGETTRNWVRGDTIPIER